MSAEWTPAFAGQRPPFQPGHTLSMRHGAHSPRVVDPIAAELLAEVLEASPYLRDAAYLPAVESWAKAEARVQLLEAWVDEHGPFDAHGRTSSAMNLLTKWTSIAMNHRTRLGLDPLSRARLGRDVAAGRTFDLAAAFAVLDNDDEDDADADA